MKANLRAGAASAIDNLVTSSLLTLALTSSYLASSSPSSIIYINLCRSSLGLVICSWICYFQDILHNSSQVTRNLSTIHLGVAAIVLYLSPPDTRYNCYIVYWIVISYRPLLLWLLRKFPGSFSFGEVALISQSVVMSVGAVIMRILTFDKINNRALSLELAKSLRWLQESLMMERTTVTMLLIFWTVLVTISVAVVGVYNSKGWKVSTSTRKIFHLAIVLVYWSGLQQSHLLLLISSYAALALMLGLEILRVSQLFPVISRYLTDKLTPFLDSKDGGQLILTNLYLLVGMSLPLWLDPGPAAGTPRLQLYCGLIAVGVADTAAAVIGSAVGRIRWTAGSGRTVEGSCAALVSSCMTVLLLSQLGGVAVSSWTAVMTSIAAVVVTEAVSSQVDNLTLPLVMLSVLNVAEILHF